MKEYRLTSWPELPPQFLRTGHRRILCDASARHLTIAQLIECSGLKRHDVIHFVEMLEAGGHVKAREISADPSHALGPFGGWLRRALAYTQAHR